MGRLTGAQPSLPERFEAFPTIPPRESLWHVVFIDSDSEAPAKRPVANLKKAADGSGKLFWVLCAVREEEVHEHVVVVGEAVEGCGTGQVGPGTRPKAKGLCCGRHCCDFDSGRETV